MLNIKKASLLGKIKCTRGQTQACTRIHMIIDTDNGYAFNISINVEIPRVEMA